MLQPEKKRFFLRGGDFPLILNPNVLASPELTLNPYRIAVDGTAGSGKGTSCLLLVNELNDLYPSSDFLYLDTGAMYRCVALLAARAQLETSEHDLILAELTKHQIEMRNPTPREQERLTIPRLVTVLLDGEDVSEIIRVGDIGIRTTQIAQHPDIRAELVSQQQRLGRSHNVVAEGRDMTSVVFPDSQLPISIDAELEVRAQRRYVQELAKGGNRSLAEVLADLKNRDLLDQPQLSKIPSHAMRIDTTHLSPGQVVQLILNKIVTS